MYRILFIVPVWLLLDLYFFQALRSVIGTYPGYTRSGIYWAYWLFDILLILVLFYFSLIDQKLLPPKYIFVFIGLVLLSFLPKLVALPFLILEDISRIGDYLVHYKTEAAYPGRRKFIGQLILGISAVPFVSIIYGMARGKYNFKVHRSTLHFRDLPAAFDGFTITQLSDIHCGSFTDRESVERGIALANAQNSDLLVFTGDLVNDRAAELDEWKAALGKLSSPFGVYSVFGNHDYGDYVEWSSDEEKHANLEKLKATQKEMGFRLLLDEHVKLEKDGEFINLAGVQNWGKRFARYGDLEKAMAQVADNSFSVLLSHDPTHWEGEVLKHPKKIHLTLAGHTHGMQFGIEIPGLRWSPVRYIYKQWAGVYRKASQYINVNRGFGFIGFSGRVGIWPEISVITLKREKS